MFSLWGTCVEYFSNINLLCVEFIEILHGKSSVLVNIVPSCKTVSWCYETQMATHALQKTLVLCLAFFFFFSTFYSSCISPFFGLWGLCCRASPGGTGAPWGPQDVAHQIWGVSLLLSSSKNWCADVSEYLETRLSVEQRHTPLMRLWKLWAYHRGVKKWNRKVEQKE